MNIFSFFSSAVTGNWLHICFGAACQRACTEGGGGVGLKEDEVREVAWILRCKSDLNADKGGGGGKKIQKFCGRHKWMAS